VTLDDRKLLTNLRWFLDNLDEPPSRIHVRGVWHDSTGGSAIGSPMTAQQFSAWVEAGLRSTYSVAEQVTCNHLRMVDEGCPDCRDSGVYEKRVDMYRWPMRAAMAKVRAIYVAPARPDYAVTLATLARTGSVEDTTSLLARQFPVMGDPDVARGHIAVALKEARRRYATRPLPSYTPERSEAQLDAEAVA
jgi:hypothetical protein